MGRSKIDKSSPCPPSRIPRSRDSRVKTARPLAASKGTTNNMEDHRMAKSKHDVEESRTPSGSSISRFRAIAIPKTDYLDYSRKLDGKIEPKISPQKPSKGAGDGSAARPERVTAESEAPVEVVKQAGGMSPRQQRNPAVADDPLDILQLIPKKHVSRTLFPEASKSSKMLGPFPAIRGLDSEKPLPSSDNGLLYTTNETVNIGDLVIRLPSDTFNLKSRRGEYNTWDGPWEVVESAPRSIGATIDLSQETTVEQSQHGAVKLGIPKESDADAWTSLSTIIPVHTIKRCSTLHGWPGRKHSALGCTPISRIIRHPAAINLPFGALGSLMSSQVFNLRAKPAAQIIGTVHGIVRLDTGIYFAVDYRPSDLAIPTVDGIQYLRGKRIVHLADSAAIGTKSGTRHWDIPTAASSQPPVLQTSVTQYLVHYEGWPTEDDSWFAANLIPKKYIVDWEATGRLWYQEVDRRQAGQDASGASTTVSRTDLICEKDKASLEDWVRRSKDIKLAEKLSIQNASHTEGAEKNDESLTLSPFMETSFSAGTGETNIATVPLFASAGANDSSIMTQSELSKPGIGQIFSNLFTHPCRSDQAMTGPELFIRDNDAQSDSRVEETSLELQQILRAPCELDGAPIDADAMSMDEFFSKAVGKQTDSSLGEQITGPADQNVNGHDGKETVERQIEPTYTDDRDQFTLSTTASLPADPVQPPVADVVETLIPKPTVCKLVGFEEDAPDSELKDTSPHRLLRSSSQKRTSGKVQSPSKRTKIQN